MATITEDYCDFETAKLLKEKGFNEPCWSWYHNGNHTITGTSRYCNSELEKYDFSKATLAHVMKWLREVHKIHIVIKSVIRLYEDTEYYYELYGTKNKSLCISCDIYKGESWDSNEQACEEAIKYCLENLI